MRYCFLLTLVQLGGGFELKGTAHRHALSLGHGRCEVLSVVGGAFVAVLNLMNT